MRLILFIFCCLCACCIQVQAQLDGARRYRLYLKNGFPSNRIYEGTVDARGFLWMATDNGLVKYNGYTCRIFSTQDGLPTNDVVGVQEDSRGRMWTFTLSNDVGYIENDRYHSVFGNKKPTMNLRVVDVHEYRGDIYFVTPQQNNSITFYKYDRSGVIRELKQTDIKQWGIMNLGAGEYEYYNGGKIYAYDLPFTGGVIRRQKLNWVYEQADFRDNYDAIFAFRARSGDMITLWIKSTAFYARRQRTYLKQYANTSFQKLYSDSRGQMVRKLWGAYIFSGDSIYRADEDTVVLPVAKNDYGSNLAVFIEDGCIQYYGTQGDGLYIHSPELFRKADTLIPFSQVRQWDNDYSGTALLKYNAAMQAPGFDLGIVRSYTAATSVLLGTRDMLHRKVRGILHSVWSNGKWLQMSRFGNSDWAPAEDAFKFFSSTCAIYGDSSCFLSGGAGFLHIKRQQDSFYVNSINGTRFSYMCCDSSLQLLIAYTDNLLYLYHTGNGRQILFKTEQLADIMPEGLERIHVLGQGRFLVKSHELLLLYDAFRQSYKVLPHFFNLEGSLVTVADGKIFAAGRFGVAVTMRDSIIDKNSWRLLPNFKGKDYTKVNDFVLIDTAVLLGTDEGVFSASKKELYEAPAFAIDSHFNFFVTGDNIIRVRDGDTVAFSQGLSKLVLDANNIYGTGTLSFRYRWKSTNSTFAQTTGDVYVGDMKPGRYYLFTIIAGDDAWHSRPLTVYLYRRPYWYQTQSWIKVFWIGGVFLFLLFVGGVILLTRYFVERKNAKKQQLIELELRALYSQINPHFIFNSLNSAQYFINARDIDKAYDHVSKFARLLRAYLKSSHDRYVTIAEEVNMLHNYVELQQERFREPFSYSIKVDNKIPKDSIQIPSLLLQPLVENAINHGLFHKKGQGHLSIEFLQGHNHEEIVCIIEDDGIGREKAKEISKANAASRYGSYGTKLTEQLIGIFERYEQMNISVTYTDKKSPQSGTIVTLTIRNVRYVA